MDLATDAFGDPFDIAQLPLPRPADGYAVQWLDTDRLLDRRSGQFLPVRAAELDALHETFLSAHAAARQWLMHNQADQDDHPLAIVPASFDHELKRHILIYGVLCGRP